MNINNINTPTDPKWNKFLVACNTNGLALIGTGMGVEDHWIIGFGGALVLVGTLGIFIK